MEDTERCAEIVFSGWHDNPCARKAGHGKDGKYCKQHALKHPAEGVETFVRWRVDKWSKAPERVECVSETDVSLVTAGGRLKKDDYHTYNTWEEAHAAMLKSAQTAMDSAERRIADLSSMTEPKE